MLVLQLFLAACGATPAPEEHNLLKIWNDQTVTINGMQTDVLLADETDESTKKITIYAVILAEKGGEKSLFVAPVEKYRKIKMSPYTIVDSNFLMVASEETGTMLFLTNYTAADESAMPIFYP